jgi:hypothetical protein
MVEGKAIFFLNSVGNRQQYTESDRRGKAVVLPLDDVDI